MNGKRDAVIEVTELYKSYSNGYKALEAVTFTVKKGEVFAYLGPNGAGKTTTINILTTLLRPTAGKASVAGHDTVENGAEIRKMIGYLPEFSGLYPNLTVRENLDFACCLYRMEKETRKKRIAELLELFGLLDKKDAQASTLSKGMRQKVGLARAVINDPGVLFLDEPTAGLDPGITKGVMNMINRLKKEGKTIVMTTHLLSRAEQVCDSIALINRGKILCHGKIGDIKEELQSPTLEDVYFAVMGDVNG